MLPEEPAPALDAGSRRGIEKRAKGRVTVRVSHGEALRDTADERVSIA